MGNDARNNERKKRLKMKKGKTGEEMREKACVGAQRIQGVCARERGTFVIAAVVFRDDL